MLLTNKCIIKINIINTSFIVSPGKNPLIIKTDSSANTDVLKSLMICLLDPSP